MLSWLAESLTKNSIGQENLIISFGNDPHYQIAELVLFRDSRYLSDGQPLATSDAGSA